MTIYTKTVESRDVYELLEKKEVLIFLCLATFLKDIQSILNKINSLFINFFVRWAGKIVRGAYIQYEREQAKVISFRCYFQYIYN